MMSLSPICSHSTLTTSQPAVVTGCLSESTKRLLPTQTTLRGTETLQSTEVCFLKHHACSICKFFLSFPSIFLPLAFSRSRRAGQEELAMTRDGKALSLAGTSVSPAEPRNKLSNTAVNICTPLVFRRSTAPSRSSWIKPSVQTTKI